MFQQPFQYTLGKLCIANEVIQVGQKICQESTLQLNFWVVNKTTQLTASQITWALIIYCLPRASIAQALTSWIQLSGLRLH